MVACRDPGRRVLGSHKMVPWRFWQLCKANLAEKGENLESWNLPDPEKKVAECVWGYFEGILMMFPDGFDAIWALWTPIWV